ncbi:polysaccharide pyruvyl transferase family protein [Ureibacillus chungkukjangi]|uniref:polysaccharide pyruvyl transferase family protein n=1 Tax=Ureibacillus chungkukjangi TaxID=1202712 RepID=UPI00203E6E32|nr:polysaccharide pyruvyl transferase family protein [Ureibacillus chungkukjangi]MCM3389083.1 polysaccharide pyruvyl transferase family protein [Ureibacillus chungkukjangi]
MKVLHLASFSGNIGDVANHESFYKCFKDLFIEDLAIEKIEIRDFYYSINKRRFDEEFVEYLNTFDLFIFGGGNFFELCWDYSDTGTTFNISNNLLRKIKVPILINGIGIDDFKGTTNENIEKFRSFLNTLLNYSNVLFTVRNDGSYEIFKKYYPEYVEKIAEIPDFGFFVSDVYEMKSYKPILKNKSIGINIAKDMEEFRYTNVSYEEFLRGMAQLIEYILNTTNYHVMLFPHILSDYEVILNVNEYVNHPDKRIRLSISGLVQEKELETFKLYKECDFIFATRFHSNICAISLNIPTFGIITYPKHGIVYEKIKLSNRKQNLNSNQIFDQMKQQVDLCNDHYHMKQIKKSYNDSILELIKVRDSYLEKLKNWMENYIGK